MKYLIQFFMLSVFLTTLFAAEPEQGNYVNGIVAIVNNNIITAHDLDQATDQAIAAAKAQGAVIPARQIVERQVLQTLINQKIALELAELNKISVSTQDVNAAIAKVAANNHLSVAALYAKLASQGLNKKDYDAMIEKQLVINQLEQQAIASSITVTPQEIDNYLTQLERLGNVNTRYDVAHILIALPDDPTPDKIAAAKQKADEVVKKIHDGMAFSQAAMTYSDSDDALKGGDLGYRSLAELPTLFVKPVNTMAVGDVVGPIQSDNGFHIIKLVDAKGGADTEAHFVTQYHVLAILVKPTPIKNDNDVRAQLLRIKSSLQNGVDFAMLAKSNSEDLMSSQNGGDLGFVSLSHLNPILAGMIKSTPLNTVSEPFKTPDGWYLIKVLASKQVDDTHDYLREQAAQAIFQEKAQNALEAWQSQIRAASYVDILDPDLR